MEAATRNVAGKIEDAAGGLTGDAKLQAEGKFDQAAAAVQDGVTAVKEEVGGMAAAASDMAGRAGSAAREAAQEMSRQAGEATEKLYQAGVRAGHYAEAAVKEQPLLAMIGVAAIGYLLSFLIHSPSSPFAPPPPPTRFYRR